ncbi:MAG: sulfatase-like hydrolase/transferase, partial [Planctomycetes bacterium]|nr:sulfatase-like hydrolase/transferase [Planctomycetota bacterium]
RRVTVLKHGATVVREDDWKWIAHRGSGGFTRGADTGPAHGQLYDLEQDPGETRNLHDQRPDVVRRLARHAARVDPSNVIIVMADDMGYGDSSVYGGWIETPGLERMAREGMTFTDFHSSGVVCSPTRAGLVTGRYQERGGIPGVVNADPDHPDHARGLADEERTFAEALRTAGYATGLFGKWHLGYAPRHNPTRHGFDEFEGFVSGNIDYHSHLDRMGTADWYRGAERVARDGYLTEMVTADAVDFIARHRDEPFCLYVAHGAVHSPIQAPDSKPVSGPDRSAEPNGGRSRDATVRGMMASLDDSVARILAAVRANGIASRTLVLFFSDNGGAPHMRNDPLRGRKGQVWEGGHRVPAIAW